LTTLALLVAMLVPAQTDFAVREVRPCRLKCKMRKTIRPWHPKLDRMAECESDGQWHIATGNGFYGGLQFLPSTWWSVGGKGLPHQHSETAQKYRAVLLIRRAGFSPWPNCGYV
jgi:hypothetical protein